VLTLSAFLVLLGLLVAPPLLARAAAAETLLTTDYRVSHTSSEPFYAQYKLDPQVVLHVRGVVLAGRERTVPKDGKVVLLLHGATVPGFVAFGLDHEQCSLMRYLARAGWDTFTLDFEGYGLSTRPLVLDAPAAFPESRAPIHSDVAVHNVERVVEFIRTLCGGASWPVTRCRPAGRASRTRGPQADSVPRRSGSSSGCRPPSHPGAAGAWSRIVACRVRSSVPHSVTGALASASGCVCGTG
jgi:hypothetical protein